LSKGGRLPTTAYRDQHLARLFAESEWSQEDLAAHLAKKWGKEVSQEWVSKHLRLGRFLAFINTSGIENEWQVPPNFTEREFRRYWEATEAGGNFRGLKARTEGAAVWGVRLDAGADCAAGHVNALVTTHQAFT
jgi:hypothetical protein